MCGRLPQSLHMRESFPHGHIKCSSSKTPDQPGPPDCMPPTFLGKCLHLVAQSIAHYSSFTWGCLRADLLPEFPLRLRLSDPAVFIAQPFDLKTCTHSIFPARGALECATFTTANEFQLELINKRRKINAAVGMSILRMLMSRIPTQNMVQFCISINLCKTLFQNNKTKREIW